MKDEIEGSTYNEMTPVKSFIRRLAKIGIKVTLFGNYPWIYLDTVNEKKVVGKFMSDHKFTVFFLPAKPDKLAQITDTKVVFNKIKEML